jgi:hypothetical protein
LHTLHEEQVHTRWYLDRMNDYGVRFGEFPVNGFFWNAVADMESPLDYVTRLPLTFEQANLDYSLHYRDLFRRAGDEATAALFQRIHDDEVGHVSYGLRWFRKWKTAGEDDWRAFVRRFSFPLSPVRAKGIPPLDVAGRQRAGFDDEFIGQLEIFSRSRGRTPRVHYFNPQAEFELAGGAIDRSAQAMARDLEILMIALARRDDIVLMREIPGPAHLRKLCEAGFEIPEIEALAANGTIDQQSPTRHRKLSGLRPWAWTPRSAELLAPLAANVGGAGGGPGWRDSLRPLFSKTFGADVLRSIGDPDAGVAIKSIAELRTAVAAIRGRGHGDILLKPAFGLAGRGHRRILVPTAADEEWTADVIEKNGEMIAEPWFDRVVDFSVQCDVDATGTLRLKGFCALEIDARGRFLACRTSSRFATLFAPEIARFFNRDGRGPWLREYYEEQIFPAMAPRLAAARFHGSLGIDAFVYREAAGSLRLRPVVEINPRFTMGRVAVELLRVAAPARTIRFSLATFSSARAAGCRSLAEFAAVLERDDPLVVDTAGGRRHLGNGTLVFNDAARAARFLAVVEVRRQRKNGEREFRLSH